MLVGGAHKDAKRKADERADARDRKATIGTRLDELRGDIEKIDELKSRAADLRAQLVSRRSSSSSSSSPPTSATATTNESDGARARRSSSAAAEAQRTVKAHSANLSDQAHRITQVYNTTIVDVARPLEAITVYKTLSEMLADAQNASSSAVATVADAASVVGGTREAAAARRSELAALAERVDEARSTLESRARSSATRHDRLNTLVADLKRDEEALAKVTPPENPANIFDNTEQALTRADSALQQHDAAGDKLRASANDALAKTRSIVVAVTNVTRLRDSARAQLATIGETIPRALDALRTNRTRIDEYAAVVETLKTRLAEMRERVALVRDKANRVKLGAHFEPDSVLELPLAASAAEFGAYTDAQFFFRTRRDAGERRCALEYDRSIDRSLQVCSSISAMRRAPIRDLPILSPSK